MYRSKLISLLATVTFVLFACEEGQQASYLSDTTEQSRANTGRTVPVGTATSAYTNKTIYFAFDVSPRETYIVDAFDLNKDGVDDVLLSGSVDPWPQLGIPCCDESALVGRNIAQLRPVILLSQPRGKWAVVTLPESMATHRAWAGKFFSEGGKTYLYFGRNGEGVLPGPIQGERSVIVEIQTDGTNIEFGLPRAMPHKTDTASVEVFTSNGKTYLIENTYDNFRTDSRASVIYRVNGGSLQKSGIRPRASSDTPHNQIRVTDADGDDRLDLLMSLEITKLADGSPRYPQKFESFIISDFLSKPKRVSLSPAIFGWDHGGMAMGTMSTKSGLHYVAVLSARSLASNQGGLIDAGLAIYQLGTPGAPARLVTQVKGKITTKRANQGFFRSLDIDGDGDIEALIGFYGSRPQYIDVSGGVVEIRNLKVRNYIRDENLASVTVLRDRNRNCSFLMSAPYHTAGQEQIQVKTSNCFGP